LKGARLMPLPFPLGTRLGLEGSLEGMAEL
jgi:hypothetical protein